MTATPPLLELRHARVVRDGATILDLDRLVLNEGEHVVILGANGSGKSTLIGLLTRDIRPLYRDDGPAVRFLGKDRWDLFEARKVFGVVSADWQQRYRVAVPVFDVVVSGFFGSVGLHPTHRPTADQLARARELLGLLGIEHLAARRMDTLSTGEARRALIARALADNPALMVLDEPCAGLDPGAARLLRSTYGDLAASGCSLVLVTHHVEDIVPEVGRVIMLRAGKIHADGTPDDVLNEATLSELFGFEAHLERAGATYHLR